MASGLNNLPFNEIVRKIRIFNGLTQGGVERLSRKLFQRKEARVPAESLRKLEAGEAAYREPSVARLRSLAQIYRIYPEDFLLECAGVYPNQLAIRLKHYPDLSPPFDLDISQSLLVQLYARADIIADYLPPGVHLRGQYQGRAKLRIMFQQLREATAGRHGECSFEIPVIWNSAPFIYILDYYSDSIPTMCSLRELYGYPAKLGHPEFVRNLRQGKGPLAHLTISGLPLILVEPVSNEARDSERPSADLERRLIRKKILNPDGHTFAIDELVSFAPLPGGRSSAEKISTFQSGFKIFSQAYKSLWGLDDQQTSKAIYLENLRITIPVGRVEYDYLRPADV